MMLSSSEIKGLVLSIEEELFKYFKDTDSKYKAKYRSLVFNIKDPKNKVKHDVAKLVCSIWMSSLCASNVGQCFYELIAVVNLCSIVSFVCSIFF